MRRPFFISRKRSEIDHDGASRQGHVPAGVAFIAAPLAAAGKALALRRDRRSTLRDAARMLLIIGLATLAMRLLFHRGLDEANIIMIYLLAVFMVSRFTSGFLFGAIGSILSVFLFNFLFTEPLYSLNVTDRKYFLIFTVMLSVALLTSAMTTQLQRTNAEKVRLAQEEEKNRQALANEKLRGTILRSISHDLRTPLTSISGSLSMLLDSPGALSESDRRRLLSDVYNESIWLNRFVENLLSMTRIDDNLLKLKIQPELVEEVVGETVGIVRRRLGGRRLTVDVDAACTLVDNDAGFIEQVLINLIHNSIAHTGDQGSIAISARCSRGQAVFAIANDGPGILPEEIDRIFDRYYVGSEERSDARRGSGLGLAICQAIVKAHGGTIQAASPAEGGVTFTFTLPVKGESSPRQGEGRS